MAGYFMLRIVSVLSLAATAIPHEDTSSGRTVDRALALSEAGYYASSYKPAAFALSRPPSRSSSHTLELTKRTLNGPNTRSAQQRLKRRHIQPATTNLTSLSEGMTYVASITFGNQTFEMQVDTGSSDTWVAEVGFECHDKDTGTITATENCRLGRDLYTPSNTFERIPNESISVSYGDKDSGEGYVGRENISLAGITVTQEVGVLTKAAWNGDNVTSGLIGLAYPTITGAESNTTHNADHYSPIFTTMYRQGLVEPYFSMAISRNTSGNAGYLTFGGLPPIEINQTWTSTDILITTAQDTEQAFSLYTIHIDDVTVNEDTITKAGGNNQYVVDSGTSSNIYPDEIAEAVNRAFNPPASRNDDGSYSVDCDAIPPTHGITINGTTLNISPLDMITSGGQDSDGNNKCLSQVMAGGNDTDEQSYILGDPFMKNVIVVFDVGATEMRFVSNSNTA